MQIIRVPISHRTKPLYAIQLPDGKYYGQYIDKEGLTRYQAWPLKRNALRMLTILKNKIPFESIGAQ